MRMTIEIGDNDDAIVGWLEPAGHPRRSFVGMLESISLLDAARRLRSPSEEDGRTDLGE